jgi:Fic/DOC family
MTTDNLLSIAESSVIESSLSTLDTLKAAWIAAQPLSPERELKLRQKLRLEWNYNSNHIEGNTLTYGETELLLIKGQTVGGHTIREYEEMKAHDVAVDHVEQLAKEKRLLGETDIRDLNKIILKEPFWKEAETIDGRPTRKQVIPGEYKTLPNYVKTPTDAIFQFASPSETPSRMQELLAWLRTELEEPTLHSLQIAAQLHHDFLVIHPFDDGNGRVARLLMNYVLARDGFPPVIIKSADKGNYVAAIRLADIGRIDALTDYLIRQLQWSLDLALRAAKGESLEEPSDVEKEIALFIREQDASRTEVKKRSPETLRELYDSGWEHLFSSFEQKLGKLTPLFSEVFVVAEPAGKPEFKNDWRGAFAHFIGKRQSHPTFTVKIRFKGYRGSSAVPFGLDAMIQLVFEEFRYAVNTGSQNPVRKLYSEPILSDEAESITNAILRRTFEAVKKQAAAHTTTK